MRLGGVGRDGELLVGKNSRRRRHGEGYTKLLSIGEQDAPASSWVAKTGRVGEVKALLGEYSRVVKKGR